MSALAGIFHLDPNRLAGPHELRALSQPMSVFGPDGGADSFHGSVAFGFRHFRTDCNRSSDDQPLHRERLIATWDGRLDNRDELLSRLGGDSRNLPVTDVEAVAVAYGRWGPDCFGHMLGDWAVAIWDDDAQELLLSRDYIGVRRLFYYNDGTSVLWASTVEALVHASPLPLTLDLSYLSGRFLTVPPLSATPYRQIRAVTPGTVERFRRNGTIRRNNYWMLSAALDKSPTPKPEPEAAFRCVFGNAVHRRLLSDHAVAAELSGGLDSSSIVCMADVISMLHQLPQVSTISYFDSEEASGDERPFFSIVESHRGMVGSHVDIAELRKKLQGREFDAPAVVLPPAAPGPRLRTSIFDDHMDALRASLGVRSVLSGLGGDELLGGISYSAPEIANHLLAWDFRMALRSVLDWSIARGITVFSTLREAFQLLTARRDPTRFVISQKPSWLLLDAPDLTDSLVHFTEWRGLTPSQSCLEWTRFLLASQLTNTPPPLSGCVEMRYPLLDRELFQFLAETPRNEIVSAHQRRSLLRRSMNGIVPNEILARKTKWFGEQATLRLLASQQMEQLLREDWVSDGLIFERTALKAAVESARRGNSENAMLLCLAVGVELWLRPLLETGVVVLPRAL